MVEVPSHVRVRARRREEIPLEDFYAVKLRSYWAQFKREHFSFWMICGYLFFEYVRPQSIYPLIDFLPWAQVFVLGALVGMFFDKPRHWASDIANVWILLFTLLIFLACTNALYPAVAWKNFPDFLSWVVIYFAIINTVTTERRFIIFLSIFLIASAKLSISLSRVWAMRGFSFTDWGLMGPPGFFQNSGELAVQMLVFAPVAYQVAMFAKPYLTRLKFWILMSFPITAAMTIIGASSRGGQLGLAYVAYGILLKGRISLKKIIVIAAVAYGGYALLPAEQKARFETAGEDKTSIQRLLYWKHGWEMIKDFPVLGVGFFNFAPYYGEHHREDMLYDVPQLPHNIFIQVGTDAGFLGLAVFGLLIYRTASAGRRIRKLSEATPGGDKKPYAAIARGLVVGMWGFVIAGQFVTITYYPFFWINLAFMIALKNIAERELAPKQKVRKTSS